MPDGASRLRSRRGFHGASGLGRDLGNVVILGTVKTDLGKTLSFIVHVMSMKFSEKLFFIYKVIDDEILKLGVENYGSV
ncbi:hypothetical protein F8388_020903 [Cannabis sativa]|uniref:Uncharacterized protein n=1 Tax=Cannabis sativa TaxID=3483 RepID=A0A7J6FKE5_CANSA|nr:hypothetical protein F8388_020903 [Cannabis sativa]